MDEHGEEQSGDPGDRLLQQLNEHGVARGWINDREFWELTLYREDDEAKGRSLIEIKGVKVWHELRMMPPRTSSLNYLPFPPDPSSDE